MRREDVVRAIGAGIAKVNIGTEIRQAYEQATRASGSVPKAQDAVYERTRWVIDDYLGMAGSRARLCP